MSNLPDDTLAEQLILLFYGADALQDYRKDRVLMVTIHQALRLFQNAVNEARIDEYDKLYKHIWAIFEGLDDAGAQTAKLKHTFRVNREFRINKLTKGEADASSKS